MKKYYIIVVIFLCSILILLSPIYADEHVDFFEIVDSILMPHLPDSMIILLSEIDAPAKYYPYIQEIEQELLQILIKKGYTVTRNPKGHASHQLCIKIEYIEFENKNSFICEDVSIELQNLLSEEIVFEKRKHVIFSLRRSKWIQTLAIGDLSYLAGGEAELKNLNISNNSEIRTSSVNEKDLKAGILIHFPARKINSVILLRTRNSFGRDDIKVYKAYFETIGSMSRFLCGVFPLQLGIGSRYLNSTVQRPYWDTGLIFNSEVTGFVTSRNFKNNDFKLYWGTNRNPSMVLAFQWDVKFLATSSKKNLNFSMSALYVNRDDNFNDIGKSLGVEIEYHQGEKLFFYGLSALRYFNGSGVNLNRKIIPFLAEYQYSLAKKWILKGAYFEINHWVEGDEWSIEETVCQEVNYRVGKNWITGLQYERFSIGDFWENNLTAVVYYNPWNIHFERVSNLSTAFRFRFIDPKIGEKRFFFGVEARIRF